MLIIPDRPSPAGLEGRGELRRLQLADCGYAHHSGCSMLPLPPRDLQNRASSGQHGAYVKQGSPNH